MFLRKMLGIAGLSKKLKNCLKVLDCQQCRKCQKFWDNPPPKREKDSDGSTEQVESTGEGFLPLFVRSGIQKTIVRKKPGFTHFL